MSWLQLDPQCIATRAKSAGSPIPTWGDSVMRGALGFTAVSVAGFAPWAVGGRWLSRLVGEAGLYAICAVVFILLSAPLLHRLLIGPGSLVRFAKLFTLAFGAYALAWTIGWFSFRGHAGSIVGLLAGTLVLGCILSAAFDAWPAAPKSVLALFLLNSAGYFVGGIFEGAYLHSMPMIAMLGWGFFYGLGFGAGLGLAFFFCQEKTRELLL